MATEPHEDKTMTKNQRRMLEVLDWWGGHGTIVAIFKARVDKWTVKQLQKATGYDDE